uniref:Uncharacterized protein n=1 Tax=Oryza meridionalis TaxID=40149 RepID=A0A0E0DXP4_9ORYZ
MWTEEDGRMPMLVGSMMFRFSNSLAAPAEKRIIIQRSTGRKSSSASAPHIFSSPIPQPQLQPHRLPVGWLVGWLASTPRRQHCSSDNSLGGDGDHSSTPARAQKSYCYYYRLSTTTDAVIMTVATTTMIHTGSSSTGGRGGGDAPLPLTDPPGRARAKLS